MFRVVGPACLFAALIPAPAWGGLYYSGETVAELPSQWRGYLIDHRALRVLAAPPGPNLPPSPLRDAYRDALAKLEQATAQRQLTADEAADLGALYVRLGQADKAVVVLRDAHRRFPEHFAVAANLGTAWQAHGDLDQAAAVLRQAVKLAPAKLRAGEEYHLKLVQLRQHEPKGADGPDDLFGARYVGESGKFEPGKMAEAARKKLPADAAAVVQQLALWLPADGRLLWQLGELANAAGDVRTAAAVFDGCVTELGMGSAELRARRREARAAADELAASQGDAAKAEHDKHGATFAAKSIRPLVRKLDAAALPPVRDDAVNPLPWAVVTDTTVDRDYRPTFAKHLTKLEGKRVTLTGFLQPLGDGDESAGFLLLEYPVGCWFCETPETTGIVYVEPPEGKGQPARRGLVRVEGKLALNRTDPEDFFYTLRDVKVRAAD